MGATIQRTRYSSDTKRVLQDHTEPPAGSDIKVISGIDILTNNQVCFFDLLIFDWGLITL